MRYNKLIICVQAVIIIGLLGVILSLTSQSQKENIDKNNSLLSNFDQADLDRIDNLVKRFNDGKGDNLMIISPTMDSGPEINDVISNGKEINWVVDHSRDAMNTNNGKTEYVCRSIRLKDRDEEYIDVQLSKCNNYKEDEQLSILSFRKDQL
ncbi:DUF4362 domain-containing protein [Paenibacillus nasutitermitis]|uniref:DUF4362 domain-containing protein n=1 Tax=Paenibacillus nasutitermitis TaxID=1652958 RepID=A0A917DWV5_9BACL|nr:DUF4362 domain-containing protein [Paenibacillus nasutitermitis]GGD76456.1 hypothetical protein GCM10010911_38160 [Paenibacillus nasutitermitis]